VPLRIVIVDAHRVFAEAVAHRLGGEPDLSVVAAVATPSEALAAVETHRPDLALVDADLGRADGVELAAALRTAAPNLAVLMVSADADPVRVSEAVRAGVSGWLTKDAGTEELLAAVRGAPRGETHIAPRILTGVIRELLASRRALDADAERLARLTPRERAVLECMADGLDRQAIARRLYLSTNTVRTHVQNILTKLGVHSSLEAVALMLRVRMGEGPAPQGRSSAGA
jgi:DNA-binding NarL/FixJ family response regulator